MKKVIADILFGLLIFIVIMILDFIVTLPFGESGSVMGRAEWAFAINRELLFTALPAALTTFAFALLFKPQSRREALRKSIIWVSVIALAYVAIGIGNGDFDLLFGGCGIYTLLGCAFAGPLVYAAIKRLR